MKSILLVAIVCVATAAGAFGQIYSNSALVSHPGVGFGGANVSAIEIGGTLFGVNCSNAAAFSMADDFVVPCGQTWNVTSFEVFSYQTGSTTTSTYTGGFYKIWNGPPNAGGAVIHDFSTTNQLTGGVWSGIYRTQDATTNVLNSQRPIMKLTLAGNGIVLPAGTYWIDYSLTGSLASGPWCPPITILGQAVTGNGLQFTGAWGAFLDVGAGKGVPLNINGSITPSNCYSYTLLQPGGPGTPLTFANLAGAPGTTAFTPLTGNPGTFPSDWFFGLAMDLLELANQINTAAPPFVWTLDGLGNAIVGPIPVPVIGVTIYYVGLNISGTTLITADAPKSITL